MNKDIISKINKTINILCVLLTGLSGGLMLFLFPDIIIKSLGLIIILLGQIYFEVMERK